jgi:hypothetical protein
MRPCPDGDTWRVLQLENSICDQSHPQHADQSQHSLGRCDDNGRPAEEAAVDPLER